jgi:hypothetical protein
MDHRIRAGGVEDSSHIVAFDRVNEHVRQIGNVNPADKLSAVAETTTEKAAGQSGEWF